MRRRRSRKEPLGLDSLLDTITNVVGVLVVILAVTQLNVAETLRSIHTRNQNRPPVDAQNLLLKEAEVKKLRKELEAVRSQWRGLEPEAAEVQAKLVDIGATIAKLEEQAKDRPELSVDPVMLKEEIGRNEKEIAKLEEEIPQLQAERDELKAKLREIPDPATDRTFQPRLPNPRPAPAHLDPLFLECRYGRIAESCDVDVLLNGLAEAAPMAFLLPPEDRRAHLAGAAPRLVRYFTNNSVSGRGCRWHLRLFRELDGQESLQVRSEWSYPTRGESVNDLRRGPSRYSRLLRRNQAHSKYTLFLVWGDSFEVYLEARAMAEASGFLGNWIPVPVDQERWEDLLSQGGSRRETVE